jgi:hypothetical protein
MNIEITIKFNKADLWTVSTEGRTAIGLSYDEMLGLVASITMPESRPCLNWLKTDEQREEERKYFEDRPVNVAKGWSPHRR